MRLTSVPYGERDPQGIRQHGVYGVHDEGRIVGPAAQHVHPNVIRLVVAAAGVQGSGQLQQQLCAPPAVHSRQPAGGNGLLAEGDRLFRSVAGPGNLRRIDAGLGGDRCPIRAEFDRA